MCTTCGCGQGEARLEGHFHEHRSADHRHADGTVHSHAAAEPAQGFEDAGDAPTNPGIPARRRLNLEQSVLARNNAIAAQNRARWKALGVLALNLVSSPGSGKTTLLVETIRRLGGRIPIAVIEGDQQTTFDADRIREAGAPALQINTGKGCHLDARMVGHAAEHLGPPEHGLLLIENVGNLVCPAGFDLGEAHKVVILSVTEGEDKPLKYPDMFAAAGLMLLNKADLLPYVAFDVARCVANARRVKPGLQVIQTSATTGEGIDEWIGWIEAERRKVSAS